MQDNILGVLENTFKILDNWLPLKIKYDFIPGLSIGIIYKGKIVYKKGYGYSNVGLKKKMNENSCYRIASISKLFTSVAILQLVEKGKIRLDDKVTSYLPWFKFKNKNINSNNITIRQLLSHTAGVFRDGITPHWDNNKFPNVNELKESITKKSL